MGGIPPKGTLSVNKRSKILSNSLFVSIANICVDMNLFSDWKISIRLVKIDNHRKAMILFTEASKII